MSIDREAIGEIPNPLGLAGIEFIEYTTSKPQALGQVLETMGFRPIARHRSREVMLYRQGPMNVIVNAHENSQPGAASRGPRHGIAAIALRVRDAGAAYRRALDRGAWAVPIEVEPMELHIPAIHGVGTSRLYFVDRWKEFSIYDVDFVPIPGIEGGADEPRIQPLPPTPPSSASLQWFGIVQYIGNERTNDWTEFYRELFGFSELPDDQRFGILPKGRVLRSPCGTFYFQLIEPEPGILDVEGDETLARVALGTPDVMAAVAEWRKRGMEFVESTGVHSGVRGALTKTVLDGVNFELVHIEPR